MGRKGKGMAQPSMKRLQRDCNRFFNNLWAGDAKPLVFGDGNEKEPVLMLIGEAPGEQEALQGKPFVGRAGKNLDLFLQVVGLTRNDVYLSNVVKIRPSRRSPAGRIVNRPPTKEEVELFLPWLMKEITLVRPMALVTLGNVALHAFLPKGKTIGACHGQWHQAVVRPPRGVAVTLPLYALYHPASVIYRASLQETYQRDMEHLRDSLRLSQTHPATFGE